MEFWLGLYLEECCEKRQTHESIKLRYKIFIAKVIHICIKKQTNTAIIQINDNIELTANYLPNLKNSL